MEWLNKAHNDISNVADQVKACLRSLVHSTTNDDT